MLVDIRNLEIMNDDPAEVDVVYAKIAPGDTTDRLQRVADSLIDRFVHSGLMARYFPVPIIRPGSLIFLSTKSPWGRPYYDRVANFF